MTESRTSVFGDPTEMVTELIIDQLSRPWTSEEQKEKLLNPTAKLWDWDVSAWVSVNELNRELATPIEKNALRGIFDALEAKITSERIAQINNQPRKSLAQLLTQEYPETKFIIEPFFERGTLNMVSAPPNTWKSWMFFLMASHVAQGTPFLGKYATEKTKVLIINEEDTERLIAERFETLGITDKDLDIYFRVAHGAKIDATYCRAIIDECKADGIDVVMFDSLRAMHDQDENSSTAMQPILDHLKMMTREGLTVIFTHHHKKKNALDRGDTSESSRGSSAINAAIFGHISLEEEVKESGTYLIFRHLKSKTTAKLAPFQVKIIVDDTTGAVRFDPEGEYDNEATIAEKSKEKVYTYLREQGLYKWTSAREIIRAQIANEKYVRLALRGMTTTGIIIARSKQQLEEENPGRAFIGASNAKFYQITPDPEDRLERNAEADVDFELI